MSGPGFDAARTWRVSRRLVRGGGGLLTVAYVAAATGHGVLGAAPFLVGMFMLALGGYSGGHAGAFLAAFTKDEAR